jgi:FtsH-binding integral membrane protein
MNVLFFVPLVCAIVIYTISFKEGKQVCDNYVLVSYLYALFYLSIVAYTIRGFIKSNMINLSVGALIGTILAFFGIQILMLSTPKEWVVWKHVLSVIFSALLGFLLSTFFAMYSISSVVPAVLATMVLFVALTLMAWKYQDSLASNLSWNMILLFLLLILTEFLVGMFYPNSLLEKGVILVVLMAISYLLLVKTKAMIENKKKCETEGGPDYVNEGTGLMLSFQNLLIRILDLFGKRK